MRRSFPRFVATFWMMTLLIPTTVSAQNKTTDLTTRIFAELGYESVDDRPFFSVRPGIEWIDDVTGVGCQNTPCQTELRLSLHLPLRLILDAEPGLIREQDWDQPSDYARVLKRLQYGSENEPLHLSIGELGFVRLGNGTILDGYVNNVQLNTFQPGVRGAVNTTYGGFDLMVDNLFSPSLVGGRIYVRPLGFENRDNWWEFFEVGATIVSDMDAPLVVNSGTQGQTIDTFEEPETIESDHRAVAGIDLTYAAEFENLQVLPHLDLNLYKGLGFHAGSRVNLDLDDISIWGSGEGRWFNSGYIPDYVGPLYDIERFQTNGWSQEIAAPKARIAESTPSGRGFKFGVGVDIFRRTTLSATVANSSITGSASTTLRLSLRPIDRLRIGVLYHKTAAQTLGTLFDFDGAVFVSEARIEIYGPFYAVGRFDQKYTLARDATYSTTIDYLIGVGAQHTW